MVVDFRLTGFVIGTSTSTQKKAGCTMQRLRMQLHKEVAYEVRWEMLAMGEIPCG